MVHVYVLCTVYGICVWQKTVKTLSKEIQYSSVQNYFFLLAVHYLNSLVPSAQQAGQAVVLGRLPRMCLFWTWYIFSMCAFV
jgi:hypothetical protein